MAKRTIKKTVVKTSKTDNSVVMFQISQIRKDMTLYSIESLSISMLALLLFIGAPSVFPTVIDPYNPNSLKIMQSIIIVPSVYWIFTLITNLFRLFKINKLQKSL